MKEVLSASMNSERSADRTELGALAGSGASSPPACSSDHVIRLPRKGWTRALDFKPAGDFEPR